LAQRVRDLVDARDGGARRRTRRARLRVQQAAELALGLCAREAVALARRAHAPDLAVEQASVWGAPAPIVGAPLLVDVAGAGEPLARHRLLPAGIDARSARGAALELGKPL